MKETGQGTPPPAEGAIDYRRQPELYRMGRGEEGVFSVEPYKSELLPLWRFRTPEVARESAAAIWGRFEEYREAGDFAGMDMARKYLQMGYTRSRRYAVRRSGRKYHPQTGELLAPDEDPEKAESARIFHAAWQRVREDPEYRRLAERYRRQRRRERQQRRASGGEG